MTDNQAEDFDAIWAYQDELIDRVAPRWAWDVIDQFIADKGFVDRYLNERDLTRAFKAMIDACENPTE